MNSGDASCTNQEVVYVKAKLGNTGDGEVYKNFAIDPNITNYNVFLGILSKCFNLLSDFSVSYLAVDDYGEQFYLPLQSDWDMDAAILTSSKPVLRVKVNIKTTPPDLKDWDIVVPADRRINARGLVKLPHVRQSEGVAKPPTDPSQSMFSQFSQRLSKTMASVQRAIGLKYENEQGLQLQDSPISDAQFRDYLDALGRVTQLEKFCWHVYRCGLEPSVRKVGWRLLLSVYPADTTGQERISLLECKTRQYVTMKQTWKTAYAEGRLTGSQLATLAAVSIDVVRTDWATTYYKGEDNRYRVCQLFDLVATYCIYHPNVGYNQGMSDLASPLLVVQEEEAPAYFCFCALMQRLKDNFCCAQQVGLISRLRHLYDLLAYTDPHLARFLKMCGVADMYFTQRWLMLELKREFSFDDILRLFEVQWASVTLVRLSSHPNLQSSNSKSGGYLALLESEPIFMEAPSEEMDRYPHTSEHGYAARDVSLINALIGTQYVTPLYRRSKIRLCCPTPSQLPSSSCILVSNGLSALRGDEMNSDGVGDKRSQNSDFQSEFIKDEFPWNRTGISRTTSAYVFQRETPAENFSSKTTVGLERFGSMRLVRSVTRLPSPDQFGYGNPFLLFVCLSLLLEYREVLLANVNDASDLFAFYQHTAKKHNLLSILRRARSCYDQYLTEHTNR
ncbi:hypothetical protein CRM22_008352 [Opisthorchis felineus]|uniref:Rab-GAP TBC domain-containing protein n=2 Tax=Opisthorchis felineus TaxID=147828 RepID=A0A4S2LBJ2_OPIFE|nr:hypothetical protein CRM22_008352 [Opisthorchis felineus]